MIISVVQPIAFTLTVICASCTCITRWSARIMYEGGCRVRGWHTHIKAFKRRDQLGYR